MLRATVHYTYRIYVHTILVMCSGDARQDVTLFLVYFAEVR
jgi:hypothetical protein